MRKIIASLDIGSNSIKLVVGEILKNRLNVISSSTVLSRGINQGFVVNAESAKEALKELFRKNEEKLGLKIKKVIVTVPSAGLECYFVKGTSAVKNEENKVTSQDMIAALNEASQDISDTSIELIALMPTRFLIDDLETASNPVGKEAKTLTSEAVAAAVPKNNIAGIEKLLKSLNIEVVDVVAGPLADYNEFKNQYDLEEIGVVINMGFTKTEVSIFNKGVLTASNTLSIGGINIDKKISETYKIRLKESEYLKQTLGLAIKEKADVDEVIMVENTQAEKIKVNQYQLSEIINVKLIEMINIIKKELNHLTKREISYIMFTGGTTELRYFNLFLEETLGQNTFIGEVKELGIRNNKYSSSAGVIKYYNSKLKLYNKHFSTFSKDEEDELSGKYKKISISDSSILGKLFGHFFDN